MRSGESPRQRRRGPGISQQPPGCPGTGNEGREPTRTRVGEDGLPHPGGGELKDGSGRGPCIIPPSWSKVKLFLSSPKTPIMAYTSPHPLAACEPAFPQEITHSPLEAIRQLWRR